jgi:hypothetical protein
MRIQTAGMLGHRRLYNYQKFEPARLIRILETQTIYCSNPKRFNDPWDCRPCFDSSILDDPAGYERQVQWFDRSDRRRNPKPEAEHLRMAQRLRDDRKLLESLIFQMTEIDDEIDKRYRVYCFTVKPDCTLMWSHYASNHSGICLEFSATNGAFSSAFKVEYCDRYPSLDLAEVGMETLLPLITKSATWSYEHEFRLIAEERSEALSPSTLKTENSFLPLPPGALQAVIVGCMMAASDRAAVHDLIKASGRAVAVREAVRVPNHYALTIQP